MIVMRMHRSDSFFSLNIIFKYFEMLAFLKDEVISKSIHTSKGFVRPIPNGNKSAGSILE